MSSKIQLCFLPILRFPLKGVYTFGKQKLQNVYYLPCHLTDEETDVYSLCILFKDLFIRNPSSIHYQILSRRYYIYLELKVWHGVAASASCKS